MIYFITKADFVGYVDVSQHVEDRYLDPCIRNAQVITIKPILCEALYNELYTQYSTGTLSYANQALLTYVKEAMIFCAYVRFLAGPARIKNTPFGMVKKTSEDSVIAERNEVADMMNMAEGDASHYLGELKSFLKDNREDYSLWNDCGGCGDSGDFGSFNITAV